VTAALFRAAVPLQVACSWAAQGGMQGWAGAVQEEGGAATGVQARGQGVEEETHGRLQGPSC
jgi:hypothetical protein